MKTEELMDLLNQYISIASYNKDQVTKILLELQRKSSMHNLNLIEFTKAVHGHLQTINSRTWDDTYKGIKVLNTYSYTKQVQEDGKEDSTVEINGMEMTVTTSEVLYVNLVFSVEQAYPEKIVVNMEVKTLQPYQDNPEYGQSCDEIYFEDLNDPQSLNSMIKILGDRILCVADQEGLSYGDFTLVHLTETELFHLNGIDSDADDVISF